MTKELLQHRINRCEKVIQKHPPYLDANKNTCYCEWYKGYWEGKKEVYEEWLDSLKE